MTIFGIGTLQLELATGDNLDQIESEVRLAKTRLPWLDMVLIPELAAFGPLIDKAQPLPGPAEQRFQDIARSTGLWLVAGSLYERTIEGVYNTTPVINPAGEVVARHRKIYPFLPYERGVLNGNICTVFDVPGVARFGISNCYDMWFPETTRTLASLGAEVIGLGQTLKSFRDTPMSFPPYAGAQDLPGLTALGPLSMPRSRRAHE